MAISMIALLIPIAIVVAIFRFAGGEDVQVQDPAPTFAEARASKAFGRRLAADQRGVPRR
jgi:hypothetical protein